MPFGIGRSDFRVGGAAQSGETVAKAHASQDPSYQYFPETGEERYESLVAAPMKIRRGIVGILVIQSAASRSFDDQDTVALETCARLLAPVVMNAQLLDLGHHWLRIELRGKAPNLDAIGAWVEVEKTRQVWLWENVRIHLDDVKGLGQFVELEAVTDEKGVAESHQRVEILMRALEIQNDQLVEGSYGDLLAGEPVNP